MNLIKTIKNKFFIKKEYPSFFNQLKDAVDKKNCILFFDLINKKPTIIVIIEFNFFICYKKDGKLYLESFVLPESTKDLDSYLIDFIKALKQNSSSISNSAFVEYFVENLHLYKNFIGLNEDDIFFVLKQLFTFNKQFFNNGNYLFIEEKTYNKWLD